MNDTSRHAPELSGNAKKPVCPEHPSFPEKLALALAAGRTAKRADARESEHRSEIAKGARTVLREVTGESKLGRTPDNDLEIFFVAFRSDEGTGKIVPSRDFAPPLSGYGDIAASNYYGETDAGALGPDVPSTALDTRLKLAASSLGVRYDDRTLKRWRTKWLKGGYLDYLARLEEAYDSERAMLDSLLVVQAELGRWGVPMEVDVIRLRLASLWSIVPKP